MTDKNKKINLPKPIAKQTPKIIDYKGSRQANESIGDKNTSANNLEKSFVHTDTTIAKPKQ